MDFEQNNFCGLGVTKNGMKGNSFDIPIKGVREQIQHLKAYASNERLMQTCVDPRFLYVARGTAEYVEWLESRRIQHTKAGLPEKDMENRSLES